MSAPARPLTAVSRPSPIVPPVAPRHPRVTTIHGVDLADDYAWLRERSDPEVAAYLAAENVYAEALLAPTRELQDALYREMVGRIKQTDLSVPYRQGAYLYYARTEEGKQYPIHCRRRGSTDAPEEVTLDLNALAVGHPFMALQAYEVSDDGTLLAYSTDAVGYREWVLRIKDLRTSEVLPDRIEHTGSVAWAADGRTLFYTVEDDTKRQSRLFRHEVGAAESTLVYEEPDQRFSLLVSRTRSRAFLLLHIWSHTTSEARFLSADRPEGEWLVVAPRRQGREYDVEHLGERFYIRVNDTGPNFRLVTAPVSDPAESRWQEVVPHRDDVMLEGIDCFATHYVRYERRDGLPEIAITECPTGVTRHIAFPEPVYEAAASGNREWNTRRLRYTYQSPVTPPSVFDYDLDARDSTLLKRTEVLGGYDDRDYVSARGHATAPDGTRVPVSLVHRRGLARDGSAPLLLNGYGAYGLPYPVGFASNRLSLLDRGFVIAIAHVRGGGELGRRWHDAGRMGHKMNSFTDFVAVAEFLVAQGYTSPDRLVAEGGSAGGLLVAAAANQRPDLFRAVVAHVPFVDVVNTMLDATLPLTIGEYEEWGNPTQPDAFHYMRQYCPCTNLTARAYPAMLVKTAFNDSQVMYWEPAKYVAKLRTLKTDRNPLLLVTNMGAGHSGASGRYDRLREVALDYAFVLEQVQPERR